MRVLSIEKSLSMQRRAGSLIPGMTELLSKRPDMFSLGVWPGYYEKAKGALVWDLDGNEYLDMSISGIGANVLGYADDDVDLAVMEAIKKGSASSLNSYEEVELAETMCRLVPWAEMARFTRSGGEAMAVAVRIARAHTGKDLAAFCGYHGWSDWYIAANVGTENALGEHLIQGLSPLGVPKALKGTAFPFRFNHPEELEKIVKDHQGEIGAVILEPIRNKDPKPEFVKAVRAMADKAGAVLIVDEISSGFRMNTGGAHSLFGFEPDMAVFSKALGNGYPIGAVIGKKEVMESAQDTFISSTCWTERVGFTAALATVKKHGKLNVGPHLVELGKAVQKGWGDLLLKHSIPGHTSGMYPMSHIDFETENPQETKALFIQLMLDQGILASDVYYAMNAHTMEHVSRYLSAADRAFGAIASCLKDGSCSKMLRGKPSATGFRRLT